MNIICAKDILNEAVTPALYAVSSKNTNQALDGFLLTADKETGILTICSYDLEKGIKVTLSGENINIKESGKIIIRRNRDIAFGKIAYYRRKLDSVYYNFTAFYYLYILAG